MDDALEYHLKSKGLSRRQFGALGLGAGFVALLPPVANAAEVTETEVTIKTADGQCDAYFVHPAKGAHPAVLVWPDIFGLRASFRQMGRRLAESGYSVLVINPFYRTKKAPTSPDHADFSDPATRGSLMALMGSLNADTVAVDAKACIAWLDAQASVDKKRKMAISWRRLDYHIWQRIVPNPEERDPETFNMAYDNLPPQSLAFEMEYGITKIQSAWRGRLSRRRVATMRSQ
jgi:carboxymethylenebutenolidase